MQVPSLTWNHSDSISVFYCMILKVVIEPGEDGFIVAHCPALKSCWSQGKTREEALRNIREAIELYLEPDPFEILIDETHEVVELTV